MFLNPNAHLVENLVDSKSIMQKPTRGSYDKIFRAGTVQDQIFRKMSAEEKIKLMSRFYRFARSLQQSRHYGTRKASR